MRFIADFVKEVKKVAGQALTDWKMRRRLARVNVQMVSLTPERGLRSSDRALTIVVPCYRHSQYLGTMIRSIAAQSVPPHEVIFVNDFSPDSTSEQLGIHIKLSGLDQRMRYRIINNKKNIGQAASLNTAIEAVESDVVMVLNDDDYLFHDAVEISVEMLKKQDAIHMLGAQCIPFGDDRELQLYHKELLKIWKLDEIPIKIFFPENTRTYRRVNDLNVTHSSCSFYKSSWRHAGGYRAEKKDRIVPFSDRDFQLRFNVYFPIGILNIPISFWRHNSSVDAGLNS